MKIASISTAPEMIEPNRQIEKRPRKQLRLFMLIGMMLLISISCNIFDIYDDRVEIEEEGVWKYYSIDPDTILQELNQGN